jgi:ribosomal protein L32
MAVQQNRKTSSKRGMRRSHDALTAPTLSICEKRKAKAKRGQIYF